MIDVNMAVSRPIALASSLVGRQIDENAYFNAPVVLTGEADVLATKNGQWCFLDALRLLLRVAGVINIQIPTSARSMEPTVRMICKSVAYRSKVSIVIGDKGLGHAAQAVAILNVGHRSRSDLPWISISARGWQAQISANGETLPVGLGSDNPISSLFAASIGVGEVFRRLVGIPCETMPPLGTFQASLYDFDSEVPLVGPALPPVIQLPNTLLVGAGAIGNGVALLASQLPLCGKWHIVDKQAYGDENMGTCVAMENEGWVGVDKAVRLTQWLKENSELKVSGERAFIAEALGNAACRELRPLLVLGSLDDVSSRHDAQMAWPSIMIDGGLGALGASVVQHRLDDRGLACLRCTFSLPALDHVAVQRSASGLDEDSLQDQNRRLTIEDVEKATPDMREWLNEKMQEGKTVCSVVSEAVLKQLGAPVSEGFRPSVPFVATAAAALMMAEAVKAIHFDERYRQTITIQNLLLGRASIDVLDRPANESCLCVTQRPLISRLRHA
jgi:hypothetical protein